MPAATIQLKPGEEHNEHTYQRHDLGTKGTSSDGRVFRYSKMGSTVGVAGNVYQGVVPIANHLNRAADVARAVGSQAVSFTDGGTGGGVDDFTEGYVYVNDDAGEGHVYFVNRNYVASDANAVFGSGAVATFNIQNSVKVALTTSSELTAVMNRYHEVIIHPSPNTAALVGVATHAQTASTFGWLQTGGPCAVLTDGTVVIAQHVRASDGTDGSVEALDRDGTHENEQELGVCMAVNATAEYSLIDLALDRG